MNIVSWITAIYCVYFYTGKYFNLEQQFSNIFFPLGNNSDKNLAQQQANWFGEQMLLVGLIYFYTLLVNGVKKYSNTTTYFY